MAEPRLLQVGNEETTAKEKGESGLSSAQVGTEAKVSVASEESSVGVYVADTNEVVDNSRTLRVSRERPAGVYEQNTRQAEGFERSKGEKNVVNTITVDEVKALIKQYGGGTGSSSWGHIGGNIHDQTDLQNEFQNVREVAEGKCNTFVLSHQTTLGLAKGALFFSGKFFVWNNTTEQWEDKRTELLNGDYDNLEIINSNFNSNNDEISTAVTGSHITGYIICGIPTGTGSTFYMFRASRGSTSFLKTGDIFLVKEINVPDRWYDDFSANTCFNKLETSKVDLTQYYTKEQTDQFLAPAYDNTATYSVGAKCIYNGKLYTCSTAITQAEDFDATHWTEISVSSGFVDLDSAQTITGQKTFNGNTLINGLKGYTNKIQLDGTNGRVDSNFLPFYSNDRDLGSSSYKWKDLYLAGKIKDGTNEFNADNVFNVINASDIANNQILTEAQFALLTNGKPTKIIGTYNTLQDIFLSNATDNSANFYTGIAFCKGGTYGKVYQYALTKATRKFSLSTTGATITFQGAFIEINGVKLSDLQIVNGKVIPAYPSSPATPKVLTYGTNNTLSWGNIVPTNAYATNSTTELKYETINNISVSADTTFTLATAPANTYPEYKANITNTDTTNAITITLPSGTIIKAEPGITVSSNTFTIPADTTVVMSLQDGLALLLIK